MEELHVHPVPGISNVVENIEVCLGVNPPPGSLKKALWVGADVISGQHPNGSTEGVCSGHPGYTGDVPKLVDESDRRFGGLDSLNKCLGGIESKIEDLLPVCVLKMGRHIKGIVAGSSSYKLLIPLLL